MISMATLRAPKSGLARDEERKIDATFDCREAQKCLEWIQTLTGMDLKIECHEDKKLMMNFFYNVLKDGTVLCRFMDTLMPDDRKLDFSTKAFQPTNTVAFASARSRERIGIFLEKVREYGITCTSSFQTDYLYEKTNLVQVCTCIRAIGIQAQTREDYSGPYIWPKKAKENKREFTQEQLQASKQTISLQYGTNIGASQAGLSFGKQRMIID
ncbi:myophilin-like isoform X2 [Mizuhopecten yessoensis]|uniref:myophilin-like isoform X2 n=1 Tax=Mizuhopecten yessoensis TaxID=6573 RepID=UPI000B45A5A0|nr:myophilin-like isoform X2 [Mizuhopecten yessoensis]